jgi:CRP-like cAMP-binding protein
MNVGGRHVPHYDLESLNNMTQKQVRQRASTLQDALGKHASRIPFQKDALVKYILEHQDLMAGRDSGEHRSREARLLESQEELVAKHKDFHLELANEEDEFSYEGIIGEPEVPGKHSLRTYLWDTIEQHHDAAHPFGADHHSPGNSVGGISHMTPNMNIVGDMTSSMAIGSGDKLPYQRPIRERIASPELELAHQMHYKEALEQRRRMQTVHKTEAQRRLLRKVVCVALMGGEPLPGAAVESLVDAFVPHHVALGNPIIVEGEVIGDQDPGLFVLERGELGVYKKIPDSTEAHGRYGPRVFAYKQAGACMGEFSLHYGSPRAATIIADSETLVWSIARVSLTSTVTKVAEARRELQISFITKVPILSSLNYKQARGLLDHMEVVRYRRGDPVITQGQMGNSLFILTQGSCVACRARETLSSVTLRHYQAGAYFGELAMLQDVPRAADIIVESQGATLLQLVRSKFTTHVGKLVVIAQRNASGGNAGKGKDIVLVPTGLSEGQMEEQKQLQQQFLDAAPDPIRSAGVSISHRQELSQRNFFGTASTSEKSKKAALDSTSVKLVGTSHVPSREECENLLQCLITEKSMLKQAEWSEADLKELAGTFMFHRLEPGTVLVTEGDKPAADDPVFFRLEFGKLGAYRNGQGSVNKSSNSVGGRPIRKGLGTRITFFDTPGDYLEDLRSINNAAPIASLVADTRCGVFSMSRAMVRRLIAKAAQRRREKCLKLMHTVPFLDELSHEENERLLDVMGVYNLQKGDLVNLAGEVGSEFFIIEQGTLGTYAKSKLLRQNEAGEFISEMSLIEDSLRSADTVCESDNVTLLGLERKDFNRIIGKMVIGVRPHTEQQSSLERSRISSGEQGGGGYPALDLPSERSPGNKNVSFNARS